MVTKVWEQDEFFWRLGVLKLGAETKEAVCCQDCAQVLTNAVGL